MRVQNNAAEAAVKGTFGAAAAAEGVQVSSLHKKCIELALLPRTCFGAYKNATARRNFSKAKKKKESAEKLFARIQTAVSHPDSCFLNKKQRKQLTSMCLQLSMRNEQQEEQDNVSTVPAAMAAAKMQKVIHDQLEESDAISVMRHVLFEMALLGTGILKGPFTNVKTQYKFSTDEETGASAMMEVGKDVPGIEAVSFVGSTAVAKIVYKRATSNLKRCC